MINRTLQIEDFNYNSDIILHDGPSKDYSRKEEKWQLKKPRRLLQRPL
jgi:hypothetical protein